MSSECNQELGVNPPNKDDIFHLEAVNFLKIDFSGIKRSSIADYFFQTKKLHETFGSFPWSGPLTGKAHSALAPCSLAKTQFLLRKLEKVKN